MLLSTRIVSLQLVLQAALFAVAGSAPVAAQAARPQPRFERSVLPGAAGPNRLDPDLDLLAGSGPALADLRLYDGAGREVPYLLVPPVRREPEWRPGRMLPIASTKISSGLEIDLGALSSIDRLRLDGIPAPFLKRFRLEGGGDRSRWTILVAQGTLFDLPDQSLTSTEVAFPAGDYRYLRITWDERTSAVVGLPASASARLARVADPLAALRVPVEFTRRESEPGKSRFHLRLPGSSLPVVALELEVGGGNLLRAATVTQGRLGNGEVIPVPVGSGTLRRALRGDLAAADLRLPLSALAGPELDLTVEDGDNPPLALTAVKAELAPLPWIYFESPGAEPITARYGDPRAQAPRYDLEAVREGLGKVRPAAARWGEAVSREAAAAPDSASGRGALPTVGAPLEVSSFRYRRSVPAPKGTGPILTSLLLDAAVLARSPGLADLRLADEEGRQIPYLVDRRSEPLSLDLAPLSAAKEEGGEPGVSRYLVELPYPNLPEARLVLATSARVFERPVRLIRLSPRSGANRRAGEVWEETLAESLWRHADPETAPPKLVLAVPADGEGKLELRIDEGDNAPLPLLPPRLLLPAIRIRFFHTGGAVRLLYGHPGLAPPRYDLALLAPQLLGTAAQEVDLAPDKASGTAEGSSALPRWAFWGVLGLAVLILLVVLARLLRDKSEA